MKVIRHNATILLYEKIEALSQEPHESWRAIYLKLSDKQARFNNELRTNFIVGALTSLLAGSDGYIYLCDDGDIFILFQGILKTIINKLSSHFGDLDPHQLRGQHPDSLFYIFDLSKHWEGFYNLAEAKYLVKIAAQEEQRTRFEYHPNPVGIGQRV